VKLLLIDAMSDLHTLRYGSVDFCLHTDLKADAIKTALKAPTDERVTDPNPLFDGLLPLNKSIVDAFTLKAEVGVYGLLSQSDCRGCCLGFAQRFDPRVLAKGRSAICAGICRYEFHNV
jgi:hypothetical protein